MMLTSVSFWSVTPVSDSEDENILEEEEKVDMRKRKRAKICEDETGLSQDSDGETKKEVVLSLIFFV